jgi:hypothetical protein
MGLSSWNAAGSVVGTTGRPLLQYGRATGRVACALISDSNGMLMGYGWDGGFHRALSGRFEMCGTGLLSMLHAKTRFYNDPTYGAGRFPRLGSGQNPVTDGNVWKFISDAATPAAIKNLMAFPGGWLPHGASGPTNDQSAGYYIAAGGAIVPYCQMIFAKHGPLAASYARLTYELIAANTQNGGGNTYPGAWYIDYTTGQSASLGTRIDAAAGATSVGTAAATGALIYSSFTLAAANRIAPDAVDSIIFGANLGANTNGPAALLYQAVYNTDRPRGFTWQAFLCKGGQSAYDMAAALQAMPDATLDTWLTAMSRAFVAGNGGNGARRMLFVINTGFNDPAVVTPSVGPSPAASNTAAGFVDNHRAIMDRIRARYDALFGAGAETTELFFFMVPSHPISDAPTSNPVGYATAADKEGWLVQYRAALALMPDSTHWHNVTVVKIPSLISAAEISNGSHVFDTTESPAGQHLNASGYNTIAGLILDAIMFTAVPGGPVARGNLSAALSMGISITG